MLGMASSTWARQLEDKTARIWEWTEWSLSNPQWTGNPFDLLATATFIHQSGKKRHQTALFYAGNKSWKFRFTGTATGLWTFETESEDPELNGHTGRIKVTENPDPRIHGFLTHQGNQYAIWQGSNPPRLKGFRFAVYMNEKDHRTFDSALADKPGTDSPIFKFQKPDNIHAYLDDAQENGFEIVYLHPGYPHVWTDGTTVLNGKNPRIETFEIIENFITIAHQRGMRVHLWMWGDGQRKATPKTLASGTMRGKVYRNLQTYTPDRLEPILKSLSDGINGAVDRRLQRYIAARLGPIAGWSMGYGFDLHEWTNQKKLNDWASYLHRHMGWDHLLCARGFPLQGENNILSYDGFGRNVPLSTTAHGPRDYGEILADMRDNRGAPHLYEERHSYKRPGFRLDMDGTRRLMWWQMMAGGMGGWFGFYKNSPHPYPRPDQLRTVREFWKDRFLLGMRPDGGTEALRVLKTQDNQYFILYQEKTQKINVDLSGMDGEQPAVAVDTQKTYAEIPLDRLRPEKQDIMLPYSSDWAVAVGNFSEESHGR